MIARPRYLRLLMWRVRKVPAQTSDIITVKARTPTDHSSRHCACHVRHFRCSAVPVSALQSRLRTCSVDAMHYSRTDLILFINPKSRGGPDDEGSRGRKGRLGGVRNNRDQRPIEVASRLNALKWSSVRRQGAGIRRRSGRPASVRRDGIHQTADLMSHIVFSKILRHAGQSGEADRRDLSLPIAVALSARRAWPETSIGSGERGDL